MVSQDHTPADTVACQRNWCPDIDSPSTEPLDGLRCALPQGREARASITLALEQLQSGDLPFHGAIASGQDKPRFDGREVLLQPLGGAGERLYPALNRLGHPRLELGAPPLTHATRLRRKGRPRLTADAFIAVTQ